MSLPSTAAVPRRIAKDQVQYLAFEGGGGAGNAYPGALKALDEHNLGILRFHANQQIGVSGIAGSSAGAITALFLSMGYTPSELETILAGQDFNEFFDPVVAGLVPRIGGCFTTYSHKDLDQRLDQLRKEIENSIAARLMGPLLPALLSVLGKNLESFDTAARTRDYVAAYLASLFLGAIGKPSEGVILEQIMRGAGDNQLLASLMFDYGIFSGQAIRNFFAEGIARAVRRVVGLHSTATTMQFGSSTIKLSEINFEQHRTIFGGITLVVTGSNLETGKTELFSWRTTPKFTVADAVRISMSIPIAYKPIVLKEKAWLDAVGAQKGSFLEGVWVDGGLFNNAPVSVFDQIAGSQEHTVALRLRVDGRTPIDNFVNFYAAYPLGLAAGTGESQISGSFSPLVDRTIELPVTSDEMALFTFAPSADIYKAVNDRSFQTVLDWFKP